MVLIISGIYCQLGDATYHLLGEPETTIEKTLGSKKSPTLGPTERTPKKP